jgi:predicted restriction endonuclease
MAPVSNGGPHILLLSDALGATLADTLVSLIVKSAEPAKTYLVNQERTAMPADGPHIDPYLFQQHLDAFRAFVREKSGTAFVSFASNPYTEQQEGYKYAIYRAARDALAFRGWTQADIGTGQIVDAAIAAIERPQNNLLTWQARFGEDARAHQPLLKAREDLDRLHQTEQLLFQLYHDERDRDTFAGLVAILGKRYPLLAYLFFLKDRSRYLPIAPSFFDRGFEHLGAEFKTSQHCSWDNYVMFLALINELKSLLTENLAVEVSLLDAHSFVWMLAAQMDRENRLADVREYLTLAASEREAVIMARVGQGRFRQSLINYWSRCAVTGCAEIGLLRASHIKPWAEASLAERLSLYNGLLLSPALDAAFDCGYVSFDDEGRILISPRLSSADAAALGIHCDMRLSRVESEHKRYLALHRSRWGFEASQPRDL